MQIHHFDHSIHELSLQTNRKGKILSDYKRVTTIKALVLSIGKSEFGTDWSWFNWKGSSQELSPPQERQTFVGNRPRKEGIAICKKNGNKKRTSRLQGIAGRQKHRCGHNISAQLSSQRMRAKSR